MLGKREENHRIMVSEADIKPFNERTTPYWRRQVRALGLGIRWNIFCDFTVTVLLTHWSRTRPRGEFETCERGSTTQLVK